MALVRTPYIKKNTRSRDFFWPEKKPKTQNHAEITTYTALHSVSASTYPRLSLFVYRENGRNPKTFHGLGSCCFLFVSSFFVCKLHVCRLCKKSYVYLVKIGEDIYITRLYIIYIITIRRVDLSFLTSTTRASFRFTSLTNPTALRTKCI